MAPVPQVAVPSVPKGTAVAGVPFVREPALTTPIASTAAASEVATVEGAPLTLVASAARSGTEKAFPGLISEPLRAVVATGRATAEVVTTPILTPGA